MTVYKGICYFHSETGTEGGQWAFQDEKFMGLPSNHLICDSCGMCWDPDRQEEEPRWDSDPNYPQFGKFCHEEDKEHDWVKQHPNGSWSYEGLHVLKNGDFLEIFDKEEPNLLVWQGFIELEHHPIFTEDVFNLWIHADQKDMDREEWAQYFIKEYPAILRSIK